MKKFLPLLAATALSLTAFSASAEENFDYLPYVGLDYAYTNGIAHNLRPNYNSLSLNVGTDYNRFFGTELFYQYSDDSKKGNYLNKIKSSFQAGGLDIYGYLPLTCNREFALLGTAGIGLYDFKSSYNNPAVKGGHDHGYGYRAGLGVIYSLDNNWSVRAVARYVSLDQINDYDHLMEYSAGIRYNF